MISGFNSIISEKDKRKPEPIPEEIVPVIKDEVDFPITITKRKTENVIPKTNSGTQTPRMESPIKIEKSLPVNSPTSSEVLDNIIHDKSQHSKIVDLVKEIMKENPEVINEIKSLVKSEKKEIKSKPEDINEIKSESKPEVKKTITIEKKVKPQSVKPKIEKLAEENKPKVVIPEKPKEYNKPKVIIPETPKITGFNNFISKPREEPKPVVIIPEMPKITGFNDLISKPSEQTPNVNSFNDIIPKSREQTPRLVNVPVENPEIDKLFEEPTAAPQEISPTPLVTRMMPGNRFPIYGPGRMRLRFM